MSHRCTRPGKHEPDLRIVLVGRAGVGKSASGNTILGRRGFHTSMFPFSVATRCQKETGEFEGETLAVVDTPGLFDTTATEEEVKTEIYRCITLSAPGPHVFLVVIRLGRFTKEEKETVRNIQTAFGEEAKQFTMILFTGGDDLKANDVTIEEFISGTPALRHLVRQCDEGYHVFNNRDQDPAQVRELLEKIKRLVERNEDGYYTTEMFKKAEAAKREKQESLLTENPDMTPKEVKAHTGKKTKFILKGMKMGAAIGTVVGATVGVIGGPVGSAVGAGLGIAVAIAVAKVKAKLYKTK